MHSNFEKEEFQAPLAEINMTPLIDIMLVLVVIFLITAPLISSAIQLNLPKESAQIPDKKHPLTISIDRQGNYYLEEKQISVQHLQDHLANIAKENPKQSVHLRADVDVNYGKVSHLLAMLQNLGISNIGFITEK